MRNILVKVLRSNILIITIIASILVYGCTVAFFYRVAKADEIIYINETLLISYLLKNFIWIGNYGVGLHGYIFKIPSAVIYMFTGHLIEVATLTNIMMAAASCFVYHKLLKDVFKLGRWSLLGCLILATSQRFMIVTPTYLREIPALLMLLITLYLIFKRAKPFLLIISFFLFLDAKEHVFLVFTLSYIVWIGIIWIIDALYLYKSKNKQPFFYSFICSFLSTLKKMLLPVVPLLINIYLMFYTSLIPVNMFSAFIFNFTDDSNFLSYATKYVVRDEGDMVSKSSTPKNHTNSDYADSRPQRSELAKYFNIIKNYANEFIDPFTFGLMSLPYIVIIPALISGVYLVFMKDNKDRAMHLLLLIYLTFQIIFFVSQSNQGRYLFAVYPIVFLFLIEFFLHNLKSIYVVMGIFVTVILTGLQMINLENYILESSLLNFTLIIIFFTAWIYKIHTNKTLFYLFFCYTYIFISIAISITYTFSCSATSCGQGYLSIKYAQNTEMDKITDLLDNKSEILINTHINSKILNYYKSDLYNPVEWTWKLSSNVPKKQFIKTMGDQRIFYYSNFKDQRNLLTNFNDDHTVVFMEYDGSYNIQKRPELDWKEVIRMKNKTIYVR